ncbi:MAG TPA: hypothetical protein VK631_22795 [Solirubrobacteraceae bacterium]|nr:hypothetical protein [Solirubrobacteraceae bacterium]
MRFIRTIVPLTLVVAAAAAAPAAAVPAGSAAVRHFEGTVVSVSPDDRSFRLRDTERGTVRIRVTGSTRFERIAGFSALRAGMTNIESTVRRSGGRWVATDVERSGGGGQHGGGGGGDDNGGDRHGGRGSDDS